MVDYNSEFEELVTDLNLSNADKNFDLTFSDFNFEYDDKNANKINETIDELYINCEISKHELEKLDEVLEKLNGESIKELLRDVYGEEAKGRPVNLLAKQLESKIKNTTNEDHTSCRTSWGSYKTARDELSDYDSVVDTDSSSEYDSCAESNPTSPAVLKSEKDLFKGKVNFFGAEENVMQNTVLQNYTDNEVVFRISEEEKIEEKTIIETKLKNNETQFRTRGILSDNQQEQMKLNVETASKKKKDKENTSEEMMRNFERDEAVYRVSEKIEEHIIMGSERNIENGETTRENENCKTQNSTVLQDATAPKRKISNKAKEISENIIGKPLKPLASGDSQKLPRIRVPLVTKARPNRKSLENLSSEKEFELKWQEIRKKMELRNSPIKMYQSVYTKD